MRRLLLLAVLLGGLWAVDAYAFDGRYFGAAWSGAKHEGRVFVTAMNSWLPWNSRI